MAELKLTGGSTNRSLNFFWKDVFNDEEDNNVSSDASGCEAFKTEALESPEIYIIGKILLREY